MLSRWWRGGRVESSSRVMRRVGCWGVWTACVRRVAELRGWRLVGMGAVWLMGLLLIRPLRVLLLLRL